MTLKETSPSPKRNDAEWTSQNFDWDVQPSVTVDSTDCEMEEGKHVLVGFWVIFNIQLLNNTCVVITIIYNALFIN